MVLLPIHITPWIGYFSSTRVKEKEKAILIAILNKTLVHGKKMFVITARGDGGYTLGGRNENLNYQDPFIKTVFAFMGITDITFIHVENDVR
jgi:hypothetical protein